MSPVRLLSLIRPKWPVWLYRYTGLFLTLMLFVGLSLTPHGISGITAAVAADNAAADTAEATGKSGSSQDGNKTTDAPAIIDISNTPDLGINNEITDLIQSVDGPVQTSLPLDLIISPDNNSQNPADSSAPGSAFVPQKADLVKRLDSIAEDSSLNEEEQERARTAVQLALSLLTRYDSIIKEEHMISQEIIKANEIIGTMEKALSEANRLYKKEPPEVTGDKLADINQLVTDLSLELNQVQTQLNEASSAYNSLQTLPSRAQNKISENNLRISELSKLINDPTIRLLPDENMVLPFESFVLELQNNLLQTELKSLTIFQDIANYKIKINSLHKEYLSTYLAKARTRQNTLMSAQIVTGVTRDTDYESDPSIPALSSEIKVNEDLARNIDKTLADNAQLNRDLQEVTIALTTTRQIEKSIQEQLSDLSGSVILSRLLNRQQGSLPEVSISFNLDELIPNLNLWMYDVRNYREQLFDVQTYVDKLITQDKTYAPYREQLVQLVRHRRNLSDELYNAMSDGLTLAIDLRTKYNELETTSSNVTTAINDHLFWLTSNQGISTDFFLSLYPTTALQLRGFMRYMSNIDNVRTIFLSFLQVMVPLMLLGFIFHKSNPYFKRLTNELALRLDRDTDSYIVTPRALFCHFFLIIPRVIAITALGAVMIFITVDDFADQRKVTLLLALHLICFLYMRQIMEPNSLMQRHFSVPPDIIARNRTVIDQIWYISIPMLLIANIREVEPTKISNDSIGYLLMLLGFLYLTYFAFKVAKRNLQLYTPTVSFWTLAAVGVITPLTISVMLAIGYYYTVIQLLNRVAITMYIWFLYLIVSHTLRRELYVAEIKIMRHARKRLRESVEEEFNRVPTAGERADNKSSKNNQGQAKTFGTALPTLRTTVRDAKMDSFRLELVNNRAFKLFNAVLVTVFIYFMYLQWNDLAGVLIYLDRIYLWQDVQVIGGKTITSSLSLGDVLLALVIVLVSVVLNRNLPLLIERLFMLRSGTAAKSTSYTIKLITSYAITTFGIIFAASALGISWDNLQWLVAALSVGLGFGLQEIFGNFVSGIIILFERQLRVGDIITLSNLSGTVSRIRIRATTIISFDNKEVVIPNKQFITSALTNWSLSNTVTKLEFAIGVAYDADVNRAKDLLKGIIRRCRDLNREKKPNVYIKSLDASAITILCEVYVNEIGKRKVVFDYLSTETLRLFKENNIEIPFDQLDVTIRNLDTGKTLTYSEQDITKAAIIGAAVKSRPLPEEPAAE